MRKKDKITKVQRLDDSINLNGINKKLDEHENKIKDQK